MGNIYLSKSQFTRGLQCHKSLWLYRNKPELRGEIDAATQARFDAGNDAGILAQQLFPGGTVIEFDRTQFPEKIRLTKEAIDKGATTIYEATFSHDDILVMVDILHKGARGWELHEVKSSNSVKEEHIPDAAVQYYVLTGAGMDVSDVSIVHMNKNYVRQGDIKVKKLFSIEEITDQVIDLQDFVKEQVRKQRKMLDSGIPDIDIGPQCGTPYTCDFKEYCWKGIPEDSVFDLKERGIDQFALYRQGIIKQKDILLDSLNSKQRFQVESTLAKKDTVNQKETEAFLKQLWYPLCYIDFETFMTAVPPFDGLSPWQQIPFQYSIYVQQSEKAKLEHYEYLGVPGLDPRESMVKGIIEAVPKGVCMVAYNAGFEVRVLKALAQIYPKHAARLNKIADSFIDLMDPFRKRHVYYWKVKGSYSLKAVLPALVPKMTYEGMEVSDGTMAGQAYLDMGLTEDAVERKRIRKAILEYCKQDTLGMVEIVKVLRSLV